MSDTNKTAHNETDDLIALLIDADNAQYKKIESIIDKVSTFGRIIVKRAYGNWSKDNLKKWKAVFGKYAIKPVHQIDYTTKKNASDIALIIDAMDFLYTSKCNCFAIVSGDSDFTPLALKIRETGNRVIGVGLDNSSKSFINACDTFLSIEKLSESADEEKSAENADSKLVKLLITAAESYQDEDGYTDISAAGQYIKRVNPDFNIKTYGVSKLSEFIEKKGVKSFDVRHRDGKGGGTIIDYRVK